MAQGLELEDLTNRLKALEGLPKLGASQGSTLPKLMGPTPPSLGRVDRFREWAMDCSLKIRDQRPTAYWRRELTDEECKGVFAKAARSEEEGDGIPPGNVNSGSDTCRIYINAGSDLSRKPHCWMLLSGSCMHITCRRWKGAVYDTLGVSQRGTQL
jgi:hypothetical protein